MAQNLHKLLLWPRLSLISNMILQLDFRGMEDINRKIGSK